MGNGIGSYTSNNRTTNGTCSTVTFNHIFGICGNGIGTNTSNNRTGTGTNTTACGT